jgi:hypothetical protein
MIYAYSDETSRSDRLTLTILAQFTFEVPFYLFHIVLIGLVFSLN